MVSLLVIIIPILIAAIVILVIGLSYKKRLNNALSGEENVHSRSVAPGEILPWILVLLLLIWNAVSLSTTFRLSQEISNLQSQILSYSTTVQEQIYQINTAMQDTVASVTTEVIDLEKDTKTVKVHVTVAPKAYSDDTIVTFTHGSETEELTKNGSLFEGDVHVGLFERSDAYVTITTGGVSQVRMVNDLSTGMLWMDFLPQIEVGELDVKLSYNTDGSPKELTGRIDYYTMDMKDAVKATKAYLVIEQNGKVLKTIDLEVSQYGSTIELNEKLSIASDEGLSISIGVENSLGLKVQRLFWYMSAQEESAIVPAVRILDENNNLIYAED